MNIKFAINVVLHGATSLTSKAIADPCFPSLGGPVGTIILGFAARPPVIVFSRKAKILAFFAAKSTDSGPALSEFSIKDSITVFANKFAWGDNAGKTGTFFGAKSLLWFWAVKRFIALFTNMSGLFMPPQTGTFVRTKPSSRMEIFDRLIAKLTKARRTHLHLR